MYSTLAFFVAAFMAVFVAALPSPGGSGITNSCNGGKVYCCNSVQSAKSDAAQKQIGVAGILAPISGSVGLTCDPISALALQKQSCTTQAACCSGNNFEGTVVLGCSPINLNV